MGHISDRERPAKELEFTATVPAFLCTKQVSLGTQQCHLHYLTKVLDETPPGTQGF